MHVDLLINNVCVRDDAPLVDIAIKGGRIAAMEPGIDASADEQIDAQGRAAIPGLVEAHLHLDKALLHRRLPARFGTLDEAIRVTGILKSKQEREDVLDRSRQVLDMAIRNGTVAIRAHPDVDLIQGLIGVETLLSLKDEYQNLLDLQIVAFPQEGILKSKGTYELMIDALRMGADVVGGCPYNELNWEDTKRHIDIVFELAQRFDAPIDMHADFADDTSDQRFAAITYIAQRTIDTGYQGRVSLGHVTSLGALDNDQLAPVIEQVRLAGISIVTLPATDLYLGGRKDTQNQRRGLTPVKALHNAGVNVAYSSNNVRNAFTPFGKADMLQIGNLLAHVAQFGVPEHQQAILDMGTHNAARAIGLSHDYGIAVGKQADLIILDTFKVADALLDIPPRLWVIKRGRITVVTQHHCEIHRHSCCCAQ
ncbi:amidohydrolase family protein [Pandoraea apista]|uniref:N-acyl-D-amino-acid deacylase n=1 Tax=Pandoraea apista TaxID=93218 RepID=A0ABX9ZV62_9BURK|nr:amidohydrolase family protein [Pandoraea apista]PTE02056.1 N-acyl-D-amino-acid deacylase [Pandoraea apista]RSD17682.1 N-acyl-D-amino-acid deacylase [Pandoraea apista]RSD24239.1 N-acyl-D-amino-acid deacylase [Pandoraea apista]RSK86390.1 N-acyl-D-amino-acid deacylase [Pandoraea apista]RSK87371.1 N-acyl-D-amino-acid deacylase [Pandoraea apista]